MPSHAPRLSTTPSRTRRPPTRRTLPVRRYGGHQQLPVHLGVGDRGSPRQDRRPDLRRRPRRDHGRRPARAASPARRWSTPGLVVVAGEITTETYVDIPTIVRETVREIGYTDARFGFDCETCAVLTAIDEQSPDIARASTRPSRCARRERRRRARPPGRRRPGHDVRLRLQRDPRADADADLRSRTSSPSGSPRCARRTIVPYLRPDGKTQVTVRYEDDKPVEITKVLIATQHAEEADVEHADPPGPHASTCSSRSCPKDLYDASRARRPDRRQPDRQVRDRRPHGRRRAHRPQDHRRHLRRRRPPRRRRLLGQGPDQGRPLRRLRGALRRQERRRRRPRRPLRGPGRLRDRRRAPGLGHGRRLGTEKVAVDDRSRRSSASTSTCARRRSSRDLDLRRPIYRKTAAYGHFGRDDHDFTWERTDKAEALRAAAGLAEGLTAEHPPCGRRRSAR